MVHRHLTCSRAVLVALFLTACTSTLRTASTPAAAEPLSPANAVAARSGMVVSASAIASGAGRDVLAAGGNAVDAAIATGFALAVTSPSAGNIGGGGFMVIRFSDGRPTTIDFREVAPKAATPGMFLDANGTYSEKIHHASHKSVGVPGTVAGFALAREKYGRLAWARLVDPAVRLADEGFAVPPGLARSLADFVERAKAYPASVGAFSKGGAPYHVGERMRQPDLARTLARIRDQGRNGFYRGETARLLAEEIRRNGGLITEEDLAGYVAKERAPVLGTYRGYEIVSMGPPSSGGVAIVQMLNILEGYDLASMRRDSPRYVHLLVEAMRRAFLDRARHLGDPDFTSPPIERLTSKAYAARPRATIVDDRASPSAPAQVFDRVESHETTNYTVVDGDGMAVSVTYTIEDGYGLGAVVPGAGFLLNNQMGDFNEKPGLTDSTGLIGTDPNLARPGQRMLSSMSPTILTKDGQVVVVVGGRGGRTIINTVLQIVLNVVDGRMSMQDAVSAPRLHHQWLPDVITVERDGLPAATIAALERMGHRVRTGGGQGSAHAIMIDARTGVRYGVADRRDPSAGAAGH